MKKAIGVVVALGVVAVVVVTIASVYDMAYGDKDC